MREERKIDFSSSSSEEDPLGMGPSREAKTFGYRSSSLPRRSSSDVRITHTDLPGMTVKGTLEKQREENPANIEEDRYESQVKPQAVRKRGFSFVPGDDYNSIPNEWDSTKAAVCPFDICSDEDKRPSRVLSPEIQWRVHPTKVGRSSFDVGLHEPSRSSDQRKTVKGHSNLETHHTSKGSVITAISDNLGSVSSKKRGLHRQDQNLNERDTRNEATIAALCAIAGNEKKVS